MLMYVDQLNLTHWEWIGIFFYWLMTIVWRLGYIFSNKNPRYFLHSRRSKLLLVTIWSRPCGPTDEANSHRRYSRHYVTRSDEASSHQRYSRLHVTRMIFTDPYSLHRTTLWKGRIDLLWTWFGPCWRVKTCQRNYGLKLLIVVCIYRIAARPGAS